MATREAAVRATLENSSYIGGIKRMGDATRRFSNEAKASLSKTFSEAGRNGVDAFKDLGRQLKSTLVAAGTLGGALTFGNAARSAIALTSSYKDLAFAIQTGTGVATDWKNVQKDIEEIGGRWKRSNQEIAETYGALWEEVGNAEFAKVGAEQVAIAMNATGKSAESLRAIVGQLNEKFGVTAAELPDAMAAAFELSNKGGVSIDDLGAKIGILGASAKQLGLEGQKGFQRLLGMMNTGDGIAGSFKKNVAGVTDLLDTLGNTEKMQGAQKELGVKLVTKGKVDTNALDKLLVASGGKREILAKVFKNEDTLNVVSEFGKTFQKTFAATEGDTKTKTRAALAAYHKALDEAGQVTNTAAKMKAEAEKRSADAARNMDDAMNKLTAAFNKPEMAEALQKLGGLLPKFAELMATVVGTAADHPVATTAAVVGGNMAMATLPTLAVSSLKSLVGAVKGSGVTKVVETAAKTAAVAMPEWFVGTAAAGAAPAATTAATVGLAGAAALGASIVAAIGGSLAAGYQGAGLVGDINDTGKTVDSSGKVIESGFLAGLKETLRVVGGDLGGGKSGKDYDTALRIMGTPPTRAPAVPAAPAVEQATAAVQKHGKATGDAASKAEQFARNVGRLSDVTGDLTTVFEKLRNATPGGGTSRGPVAGLPTGSGSGPMPSNK